MAIIYLYIERRTFRLKKQIRERKEKGKRMGPAVKLKLRGTPTVLLRIYIVHSYNRERRAFILEKEMRERKEEAEEDGARG